MKNFTQPLKLFATVFVMSLVLVSCGKERRGGLILVSNCPAVGVVEHLNALTRFNGQGQTNKDVEFDAHIADLEVSCSQGTSVVSDISFSIRAKKGPAFRGGAVNVNYYVVVMRDNYFITNKKVYSTTLTFDPGSDTAGVRERIRQSFASFEEPRRYDYEILIGFEVTSEELAFNVVR